VLQRSQQVVINRMLRQPSRRTPAVILLKALALFTAVGKFAEAIRQLNPLVIHLKPLCHPMIFRTDLR
jgi:hypothetical protein